MKRIVCVGGGNGITKALLPELKKYDVEIATITSMVDNGGSTKELVEELNVLPPGDIRRHMVALSQAEEWKKKLFSFRFGKEIFGKNHVGRVLGNIFIAGLEYILQDYEKVLEILHDFLKIKGKCLPATIEKTKLFAILENGEIVEGEEEIDVPKKHNPFLKIKEIFLKPEVEAFPPALKAIREADAILIGPGDLYSSLLPCFLPKGLKEALISSRAKKILICPSLTKLGETNSFSVLDFCRETERYMGCELDFVIYNSKLPSQETIEKYREVNPFLFKAVKVDENLDERFLGEELLKDGEIEYNSEKLVSLIMEKLLCENKRQ